MITGKVFKYGANVDTDAIIPARYLNVSEPSELARHCMEDIDLNFVKRAKKNDIMVATTNFGCGSSREHAPIVIKAAGISAVVASSFARIFFRNAINIGLPLLESPEAVEATNSDDVLQIELESGTIRNVTKAKVFKAKPYPPFMRDIISSGGLVEYTRNKIAGSVK
jgi:3-isopropylmalate/(R)-2-methylmalate dehydratase small subunit